MRFVDTMWFRVHSYLEPRGGVMRGAIMETGNGSGNFRAERWDVPTPGDGAGMSSIIIEYLPTIGTINVYDEVRAPGHDPEEILSVLFKS